MERLHLNQSDTEKHELTTIVDFTDSQLFFKVPIVAMAPLGAETQQLTVTDRVVKPVTCQLCES